MAAIAVFLIWKAIPGLQANTANFFTTQDWTPDADPAYFGIAALAFGTIMTAIIAMLLAVPVGIGIALFIAHYAHRGSARRSGSSPTCSPRCPRSSSACGASAS